MMGVRPPRLRRKPPTMIPVVAEDPAVPSARRRRARIRLLFLLADEPVVGELISPCYSLFSPVMFEKSGNFPFLWNDLPVNIFFKFCRLFRWLWCFPFAARTAIIPPQ